MHVWLIFFVIPNGNKLLVNTETYSSIVALTSYSKQNSTKGEFNDSSHSVLETINSVEQTDIKITVASDVCNFV